MATAMYAAPTAPTTLFDYAPGAPAVTLGPPPPPRVVPAAADVRRAAHCCVFTGVPMSPVVAEYGQQNPGDHAAALSCCYGAAYGASTPSSSSFTGVDASSAAITFPAACVWLDLRNRKSSGQLKRSSRAAHGAGLEDLFDAKRRRSGPLEVDDGECSDDDRRDPLDASQRGGFFETTTTTSSHRNGGVAHYDAAASSSSSSRPHRRHAGDPRDLGVASMMPLARTTARGDHRDGFRRRRRDILPSYQTPPGVSPGGRRRGENLGILEFAEYSDDDEWGWFVVTGNPESVRHAVPAYSLRDLIPPDVADGRDDDATALRDRGLPRSPPGDSDECLME